MSEALSFVVAIPARYASTRLPGKPLREIDGRPMIHHVIDRGLESGAGQVVVATDSREIADSVSGLDCEVRLTAGGHRSGTERLAECAALCEWPDDTIVVNLQGDEPLLPGELLHRAARDLSDHPAASVASLCHRIDTAAERDDPHAVKVVMDEAGFALYFSRAPVPFGGEASEVLPPEPGWYRHIGIYAYRAGVLRELGRLAPTALEQSESLEQLRALGHGYRIHMGIVSGPLPPGVDTAADLERVESVLKKDGPS